MNRTATMTLTILAIVALFTFSAYSYLETVDRTSPVVTDMLKSGLIRTHSPTLGPQDAPVTIVEFLDPSCEACRAFFPIVEKIRKRYPQQVRVVVRYANFHQGSDEATRILEAARQQGKFEVVLAALFDAQPRWASHGAPDLNLAWEAARAAGLDVEAAKTIAQTAEFDALLAQESSDVKTHKVRQTPTFYVNGKLLVSLGEQQLNERILEEIISKSKQ